MRRTVHGFAAVVVAAVAGAGLAADNKPGKAKADPPGTPLELTLSGATLKYTLDTGGLTPAAYKKQIEDALKAGGRPPAAPAVDLVATVKNTGTQPLQVWTKGDPVVLTLELKGKGAVNATPQLAFTQEFRLPQAMMLAPGKSVDLPVKALTSGHRGMSQYSYWTAPGDYELVATLKTGVSPAPKGATDNDGFVTLTSAPLKLKVEEKK